MYSCSPSQSVRYPMVNAHSLFSHAAPYIAIGELNWCPLTRHPVRLHQQILAELPSSMDTVTIPSPQHGRDMPPIIIMFSSKTGINLHWWLFVSSQCQLVLNTLPCQHRCSLLGAPHSHLHGGEGWHWYLVPCFVSRIVLGPVSNLTALETTCPALLTVFCNVTLAVAFIADHIGNGATLSSRCNATMASAHSHGHIPALVPSCQYSGSYYQFSHGQGFNIQGLLQLNWNGIRETNNESQLCETLQSSSLEPSQSSQLPDFC